MSRLKDIISLKKRIRRPVIGRIPGFGMVIPESAKPKARMELEKILEKNDAVIIGGDRGRYGR